MLTLKGGNFIFFYLLSNLMKFFCKIIFLKGY
jgi:hypothetical protein